MFRSFVQGAVAIGLLAAVGCGGGDDKGSSWELVADGEAGALLSVWGTTANDVWVVGADAKDGKGPMVLHVVDGEPTRVETGQTSGDLWWVHGFDGGPIYMGGTDGVILKYENDSFTLMDTPGTATVFGIWGATTSDVWAVGGGTESSGGFAWRLDGDAWVEEPSLPADVPDTGALWKIHGTSANDAWLVGSNGLNFHWDGSTLTAGETGVGSSLFTVYAAAGRFVAVGGLASGIIVENDGGGWTDATPNPLPDSLTGVALDDSGGGYAVGFYGSVFERVGSDWVVVDTGLNLDENLHGVWIDPDGGVWAVGGNTILNLDGGVLLHKE